MIPTYRRNGKKLNFCFNVDGTTITTGLRFYKFAEKDSSLKLMYAIGQSSMFEQTDEHYRNYLLRMVNKGISEDEQLTLSDLNDLLHGLTDEGYASNGGPRYKLTDKSKTALLIDIGELKLEEESKTSKPLIKTSKVPAAYQIIKPKDFPRLSVKGENGWLDEEQMKLDRVHVKSFGFRNLEILAELEVANGVIEIDTNRRGGISSELRIRIDSDVGADSYIRSIKSLVEKKYIILSDDESRITLTAKGKALIALMKSYPDAFKEQNNRLNKVGTSLNLIELLMNEVGVELDIATDTKYLPESTDWYMSKNNNTQIIPILAEKLNISEDALVRRIFDLQHIKKYVETIINYSSEGNSHYSNIRIMKNGLEFALKSQRALREKEAVLLETEVEEAQELYDACIYLSENTGATALSDELKSFFEFKSMFEFSQDEFDLLKTQLGQMYESLRNLYVHSSKVAA